LYVQFIQNKKRKKVAMSGSAIGTIITATACGSLGLAAFIISCGAGTPNVWALNCALWCLNAVLLVLAR
jgi:diaminopimelate epimerase